MPTETAVVEVQKMEVTENKEFALFELTLTDSRQVEVRAYLGENPIVFISKSRIWDDQVSIPILKAFECHINRAFVTSDTRRILSRYINHLRGGRLSTGDDALVRFLEKNGHRDQWFLAQTLSDAGYRSKSGLMLSNAHVSNFLRKELGIRQVGHYSKPNYQGCNWHKFV